jgi:hypothetical protein
MPEDIKALLNTILKTQEMLNQSLMSTRAQLDGLILALIRLDQRVAILYSESLESEQKKQAALLEQILKEIALSRATVSKTVQ